ncbi:zinc metalloproteinase nas-13-like [Pollicipes pollicipes]|uniref:zinc metalloproteinase nas-13-like n=1 Tax=Pollicipes pollicipes TaxID=41117 RepID=UPI001884D93F|nr:zinc metalloproteinase nas-13-like [Pollicipes pollicipes]
MQTLRVGALLATLAAATTLRLPDDVLDIMSRARGELGPRRWTGWYKRAGDEQRAVTAAGNAAGNVTGRAGTPPTPAGSKRAGQGSSPPPPPPIWSKRVAAASNSLQPAWRKRSESDSNRPPPPPSPVWLKRSGGSDRPQAPWNAPSAEDDDEYGLPLTPEDFDNAEHVSDDAPRSGAGGADPIELAGLFEGDIAHADAEQLGALADWDETLVDDGALLRNAVLNPSRLWPGGQIPYTISSSFSAHERAVVARAAQAFATRSCLRLVPRDGQADYVHVKRGRGCSSDVGVLGGRQELSLGEGCLYTGIVIHELLHAAGFWHEQSRADRDEHVLIHWDNIRVGMEYNFHKKPWSQTLDLGEPYDVGSVLHYGPRAFAADPTRPTITPLQSSSEMGQRNGFSATDVAKLNRLYGCDVGGPGATTAAPPAATCRDVAEWCRFWADGGECERNKNWMAINCAQSCGACGACDDRSGSCAQWAAANQCTANWSYMSVFCRRACGLCGAAAACDANPDYMTVHCKKACGSC